MSGDRNHLLFGHHGGVLETTDGGRSWRPLPVREDAMAMRAAADGSIVIAGHHVLAASSDGGRTWAEIESDLPNTDIHAFARDPSDPERMWAYLATGGVYESADRGRTWHRVFQGHVLHLIAVVEQGEAVLLGVGERGILRSTDGGRTWGLTGPPPDYPVFALAATPDGNVIVASSGDGVWRSDDAGAAWRNLMRTDGPVLAVAVSEDGRSIGAVTRTTHFYRSDDGGASWPGP